MKKRGRPKQEVSKKREALLFTSAELFRHFGFEKVHIDEICAKSGTSKMTFYRHFEDKADLALVLLERANLQAKEDAERILSEKVDFSTKFKNLLEMNEEFCERLGLKFMEDLTLSRDLQIQTGIQKISKKIKQINLDFMDMGKKEGFLNPELKSEFILFLAEKISALFKDPTLAKYYPSFSQQTKILREVFYFGVTKKK